MHPTLVNITKLGHCCLLIKINGVTFLTDPGNYTTDQNEVKNIDYIVISHEHTDHLHIESVKKIIENNPEVEIICNSSIGKLLAGANIPFQVLSDGQKTHLKGVEISAHGTKHAIIYREYEQVENTGYFIANKFFYPGDAFHDPERPIDILAFPVTGPWCTIASAVDYVLQIRPKIAIPVHDGNLLRRHGVTERLPKIFLEKEGVKFMPLELGNKYDFQ